MPSVWAIGDIHGENAKLDTLLSALPRGDDDITVFLGDYIDRGPSSALAVRRVLHEYDTNGPDRTILLWGNHEDMAARHFKVDAPSTFDYDPYVWFANGGKKAMASWGVENDGMFDAPCPDDLGRLFPLLRTFWRSDDPELEAYIWVHAGIPPEIAPEEAKGDELLWIREGFLDLEDTSGRIVIHGHTPGREVRVRPDKIGIDTGAVFGGVLTALQLPERRLFQADASGRVIQYAVPPPPSG